jgi:hypothetical protein
MPWEPNCKRHDVDSARALIRALMSLPIYPPHGGALLHCPNRRVPRDMPRRRRRLMAEISNPGPPATIPGVLLLRPSDQCQSCEIRDRAIPREVIARLKLLRVFGRRNYYQPRACEFPLRLAGDDYNFHTDPRCGSLRRSPFRSRKEL